MNLAEARQTSNEKVPLDRPLSISQIRSRPFIAPSELGLTYFLTRWLIVRPSLALLAKVNWVEYELEELKALKPFRSKRMVIVANHVSSYDALVAFHSGLALRRHFFILSTRENFFHAKSWYGWLIHRCGAYSVRRGVIDTESMKCTKELFLQSSSAIFIFPEGGSYSRSDMVFPFNRIAIRQFLKFVERMPDEPQMDTDTYVLPMAIKYRFAHKMKRRILKSLSRLEEHLGKPSAHTPDLYRRLQHVAEKTLSLLEAQYEVSPTSDEDVYARLNRLRDKAMGDIAAQLGMTPAFRTGNALRDLRTLHDGFTKLLYSSSNRGNTFDKDLRRSFLQVENWIAVTEGYLRHRFDTARVVDLLRRIELEVFGRAITNGRRIAVVRFGSPIQMNSITSGTEDVESLTLRIEAQIQNMLDQAVY